MKNLHSWIPFYKELATKLREYNTPKGRKALAEFAGKLCDKYGFSALQVSELDPFSLLGFISRSMPYGEMTSVWKLTKGEFDLSSNVPNPTSFVPLLRNANYPYSFRYQYYDTSIDILWNFFIATLEGDQARVRDLFHMLISNRIDLEYLSRDLSWIDPYNYLPISKEVVECLKAIKVVPSDGSVNIDNYFDVMSATVKKLKKGYNLVDFYKEAMMPQGGPHVWLVGTTIDDKNCAEEFLRKGIWSGRFSNSNADRQQLNSASKITKGDILVLKSTFTKGKAHDVPAIRVNGIGIVDSYQTRSEDEKTKVLLNVKYISCQPLDFEGSEYGSYRKTVQEFAMPSKLYDYIRSVALDEEYEPVREKNPLLQPYIELLEANKNLVLTGAPGTGKTYLAKQIAKEMMDVSDDKDLTLVQFHPSYDYTDFVEGLRPVQQDGQIVFQREDGTFKAFCKVALANLADAKKSQSELNAEEAARKVLSAFIADSIDDETVFKTQSDKDFSIVSENNISIQIHIPQNEKAHHISVSKKELLQLLVAKPKIKNSGDVGDFFGKKYRTQQDTYMATLYQAMRNKVEHVTVQTVNEKKFVFIIDEINRGDLSKILGDLFYSIDPGYRGKDNCCVKTQYQNLVDQDDEFGAGFFVPENVYILATMNDIDRSVESMDFAIRRRFAWKEVYAADTMNMLDGLSNADEAKQRLNALNEVIANDDTLGTAYQIGASFMFKLPLYNGSFDKIWQMHIEGTLKEYTRGMRNQAEKMEAFKKAYNLK